MGVRAHATGIVGTRSGRSLTPQLSLDLGRDERHDREGWRIREAFVAAMPAGGVDPAHRVDVMSTSRDR